MNNLHADHNDVTGAYGHRFSVVQELVKSGAITTIPDEFLEKNQPPENRTTSPNPPIYEFEDSQGNVHANHHDVSGEYRRQFESKYGPMSTQPTNPTQTRWRDFLKEIIATERDTFKTS